MLEFLPGAPVFTSDEHDMFQLVSILRAGSYMVSSRYHGIVTCMPSLVASAGVTMDERIRNLMRERGHEHLVLAVDDADLEPKLLQMMEALVREADSVREGIGRTVVRNLQVMARMGTLLEAIFAQLQRSAGRVVLREIHGEQFVSVTRGELLEQVCQVRAYLRTAGVRPGDRCALLALNSIHWVAFDLALMAEGLIVVPLYARQSP